MIALSWMAIFAMIMMISSFHVSKSQQCKDVALVKNVASRAFWNPNDVELIYGNNDDYRLIKRLGEGSYGEAYLALNVKENYTCVIKIYKEKMNRSKMVRELLIMQNLCGGPNIIKLHDVIQDVEHGVPAVVIEYVNATDYKTLFPTLTDREVRYYMRNVLKAIEYMHKQDVIHKDIKPPNIVIDHNKRIVRLIDFGISRFHYSGANHTSGGTVNFMAPEILLGYKKYNSKVDIWSFGVMLAGIIFQREYFFNGASQHEQLSEYAKVLGNAGLRDIVDLWDLHYHKNSTYIRKEIEAKPWEAFITPKTKLLATPDALEVLRKTLRFNPRDRPSASDLLKLGYFM